MTNEIGTVRVLAADGRVLYPSEVWPVADLLALEALGSLLYLWRDEGAVCAELVREDGTVLREVRR